MHQCALQTHRFSVIYRIHLHTHYVKNSIPYSQFLRLRRLCSEDSDISLKSEEMCDFFDKHGYHYKQRMYKGFMVKQARQIKLHQLLTMI